MTTSWEANQSIIQAEANFSSARALVVSARSSLFPAIAGGPSYTNSRFSQTARNTVLVGGGSTTPATGTGTATGTTGVTGTSSSPITNIFSFPVDATYTVDLWHKVRNTVAANVFTAQASSADIATAVLSTQAELAQDYFEVRALDAERKIFEDTVENYQANLKLIETLFNAGIDSEEDVAQARTQLDTATAQMTDLGVNRANYEHAIAVLIGKPPAVFALPVAPFVPNPPDVPVAIPSELLQRRPDIAAAERRVAAANMQIGVRITT